MGRLEEQRAVRTQKRDALRHAGIDPYPATSHRTHTLRAVRNEFSVLENNKTAVTLAGRIMHIRAHGGSTFLTIEDEDAQFQIFLKRDVLGDERYHQWCAAMDIGDFFEFTGTLFATKKQEQTLAASDVRVLTKALRAIPERYYGLKDTETRLRKRYLDLLTNPASRQLFRQKALFWKTVREFLCSREFLEVETPVLESVPGGAEAEPFITHYRALDREVTLRISLELPLKRLLVGGYEKVFEIGRIFRNEGMSLEHLQDYTQCEFYWAYADYERLMTFVEALYREAITALLGTLQVSNQGTKIDWGKPWQRYDYVALFQELVGLDPLAVDVSALKQRADDLGVAYERFAQRGRLIDLLYKKAVRPTLIQPGFLVNPPVDIEPLAKKMPDDPRRVQRLQVMAWGTELGKGFSELNDPDDQRQRFQDQMRLREAGDKEAQQLDADYVEALEYGMPPAAGFGFSERLFAVLMDTSVREAVLFPAVRTKLDDEE